MQGPKPSQKWAGVKEKIAAARAASRAAFHMSHQYLYTVEMRRALACKRKIKLD